MIGNANKKKATFQNKTFISLGLKQRNRTFDRNLLLPYICTPKQTVKETLLEVMVLNLFSQIFASWPVANDWIRVSRDRPVLRAVILENILRTVGQ